MSFSADSVQLNLIDQVQLYISCNTEKSECTHAVAVKYQGVRYLNYITGPEVKVLAESNLKIVDLFDCKSHVKDLTKSDKTLEAIIAGILTHREAVLS